MKLPKPPYYAVIFHSTLRNNNDYEETANRMCELAEKQTGFLGVRSVRDENGEGITVSYWSDLSSISQWKNNAEHQLAQHHGREKWYRDYRIEISHVEHCYEYVKEK